MDSVTDRVRRGAALLDRVRPGWAENVPTDERLRMERCKECILGHLYGHFFTGLECLDLGGGQSYGFALDASDESDALADAWRAEISARTGSEAVCHA